MMSLSEVMSEMLKLMWKKNNSSTFYLTDVVTGVKMFLYPNTNFTFPGHPDYHPSVVMLGCMTVNGFLQEGVSERTTTQLPQLSPSVLHLLPHEFGKANFKKKTYLNGFLVVYLPDDAKRGKK